jgi:DNA polymerase-3 subunit alpha
MTFKIQSIELLSEVLEDRAKELKLKFNLKELNRETLESVREILETHKGNKRVVMEVYDEEERIQLDFLSRKALVNVKKSLINELSSIENLKYQIISKN